MDNKTAELIFKSLLSLDGETSIEMTAMGGRNTVLKIIHQEHAWALRFNYNQSKAEFTSGMGWQTLLQSIGVPAVGVIAADLNGEICGITCTVSPWIDALDIEKVLPQLNIHQLKSLGQQIGVWSEKMSQFDYEITGAGLLMFGASKASSDSWQSYLKGNALWRYEKLLKNLQLLDSHKVFEQLKTKWLSQEDVLKNAPQSLFAWDIGDRNVLVDAQGCAVALVDVDELMYGDSLISPALAHTSFAIQGLNPCYEQYVESWLKSFTKNDAFAMRFWLYKTYWLFNLASKIGTIAKTGLLEVGQKELVKSLAHKLNSEFKDINM